MQFMSHRKKIIRTSGGVGKKKSLTTHSEVCPREMALALFLLE